MAPSPTRVVAQEGDPGQVVDVDLPPRLEHLRAPGYSRRQLHEVLLAVAVSLFLYLEALLLLGLVTCHLSPVPS